MATQYYTASSLDGFIATADDSVDWLMQLGDVSDTSYPDFIKQVGAIAMGSSTYEWMLRHISQESPDKTDLWPYAQPTWVFSHQPRASVSGADIRFVQGDVRPVHEEMLRTANGKNIWLVGGGELVGQFFDAELLDELIVQIAPVTLGTGKPLLPRLIAFPPLDLQAVRAIGAGLAELRYRVPHPTQAEFKAGSMP